jgi:uncharacterized membrane-anchored protein YhcB (DUF1043 family)
MKKNILLIVAGVLIAVLLYFLLSEPKQVDTHKAEYEQLQNDYNNVVNELGEGMRIQDSLKRDNARRDTIERLLKIDVEHYKRDLDKSVKIARAQAEQIKRDTSTHDPLCDSLADEVVIFSELYEYYRDASANLVLSLDSTKTAMAASIEELEKRNNDLMAAYKRIHDAYTALIADQATLQKSLKRQRLKTKLAALLGLALTGAALIK